MALAVVLAILWALGSILGVIAYAVLDQQTLGTTRNLLIGMAWLRFSGGAAGLIATCSVTWQMVLRQRWSDLWEIAAASLSTLLIVIGLLVDASAAPGHSAPADVVAAVGIGGWMILALVRAARCSLVEQSNPDLPRQARLWLAASGGLLAIASAIGLPAPSLQQAALAVTQSVIALAGILILVVTLMVTADRGWIRSRHFPTLAIGLWVLGAAYLARAIAFGLVLGPSATLLGIRVGVAIPMAMEAAAWLIVAAAAFGKTNELSATPARGGGVGAGPGAPGAPPPGWYSSPDHPESERWWDGALWAGLPRPTTARRTPPHGKLWSTSGGTPGEPTPPGDA